MTNYYVGDAVVCGRCVTEFELPDESPVDPDMFAFAPVGCAIHVYGENPDDLR